jgi:predicted  nucleic acid-binding Zn-ribbon protein
MADVENLTTEWMRRLDVKLDRLTDYVVDMTERVSSMEQQVSGLRRDFADLRSDVVRIEHKLDASDKRVAYIEKRLDLVDG